jgi:hypothetical protein
MAVNGYNIKSIGSRQYFADLEGGSEDSRVLSVPVGKLPYGNKKQQVSPSLKVSLLTKRC